MKELLTKLFEDKFDDLFQPMDEIERISNTWQQNVWGDIVAFDAVQIANEYLSHALIAQDMTAPVSTRKSIPLYNFVTSFPKKDTGKLMEHEFQSLRK